MKAKRISLAILLCLLAVVMAVLTSFAIFAEEAEPSVSIDRFNLSFNETIYIKYAVSFNGVDVTKLEAQNRGMLFWTSPQASYTRENAESVTNELFYDSTISSYLYTYTKLAAKQMTDVIYSRAYVVVNGETYYSEVEEYSILRYAYNKLGKSIGSTASTNEGLKKLLGSMLDYGAAAQSYFNYKADRPANADFVDVNTVGGVIAETGFSSGLYLAGDEITLSAPEKNEDGYMFEKWIDSANKTVSERGTDKITVASNNETYTAIYHVHSFENWTDIGDGNEKSECSCGAVYIRPISTASGFVELYYNNFESAINLSGGTHSSCQISDDATHGKIMTISGGGRWDESVALKNTTGAITIVMNVYTNNFVNQTTLGINGVQIVHSGGDQIIKIGAVKGAANKSFRALVITVEIPDLSTGTANVTVTNADGTYPATGTVELGPISEKLNLYVVAGNNSMKVYDIKVTQKSTACAHEFGEWEKAGETTCTDEVSESRSCVYCNKTETIITPATGHRFYDGVCVWCDAKYIDNVYLDSEKTDVLPKKGNYVVYVDDENGASWDYNNWRLTKDSDTATVYFFTVDKLYSSVAAMVADKSNLNYGDVVGTISYYEGESRGAAIYEIINSYSSSSSKVYLSYGKYASLSPFTVGSEKIVSVDQFGAYANGVSSDVTAITNAIKFSGATVVEFEGKAYLQTSTINVSNISNKTVNGKGAYIYNNYSSLNWTDFNISSCSNLTVKNLELRCTETTGQGALYQKNDHVQLYVDNSSNIVFDNMIIYAPDNSSEDRHITSVWIHNGNYGVTLQNSTIKNLCNSTVGGAVWISGSDNVKILNNYIEKCSCDETIACFNGDCDAILIEGNYIYTHDEPESLTSSHVIGFSVNMTEEVNCSYKNIIFRNNELDVVTQKDVFMFGNVDGVKIYGNKITARQNTTSKPITEGIFRVPDSNTTQSNVEIYGNDITLYNRYSRPISVNCTSGFTFTDNNYNFIAY